MALSHKAKKRWALAALVLGLPIYIVITVTVIDLLREATGRPNVLVEFVIFAVAGVLWALPLKPIFKGVGREDPGADGSDAPRS